MEGFIAAVQPFAGPAVFIALMFLMHGLHGGHGGHAGKGAASGPSSPGKTDQSAAQGPHQHG